MPDFFFYYMRQTTKNQEFFKLLPKSAVAANDFRTFPATGQNRWTRPGPK
jgi:hypothetical protein